MAQRPMSPFVRLPGTTTDINMLEVVSVDWTFVDAVLDLPDMEGGRSPRSVALATAAVLAMRSGRVLVLEGEQAEALNQAMKAAYSFVVPEMTEDYRALYRQGVAQGTEAGTVRVAGPFDVDADDGTHEDDIQYVEHCRRHGYVTYAAYRRRDANGRDHAGPGHTAAGPAGAEDVHADPGA